MRKIIKDPLDYDTWFDYLRMVEQEGDSDVVRDTYERAISNIPDSAVKGIEILLFHQSINYCYKLALDQLFVRDFLIKEVCIQIKYVSRYSIEIFPESP